MLLAMTIVPPGNARLLIAYCIRSFSLLKSGDPVLCTCKVKRIVRKKYTINIVIFYYGEYTQTKTTNLIDHCDVMTK